MGDKYKPLPDYLTIKESRVHGLGLFTKEDIPSKCTIGISHIRIDDNIHRTPLGGFYNHSDAPNCVKEIMGDVFFLSTIREIKAGEELTCSYTFYNVNK